MATRSGNSLDDLARRPLVGFFFEQRITDGKLNFLLIALAVVMPIGVVTARLAVPLLGVSAIALLVLWRNWRRYRQRLAAALSERDRPPGSEPVLPEAR